MNINLINGDCLKELAAMPESSVDSIVTDPPYGLSFMGKKWDYDVPSVEMWRECLRVLKPGGHLLAFAGTRTQHRMAVRIEDAGFEIRDMIAWVYGSGFPKSHNLKDDWQGWGTALKPALEPITIARKPFKGTVADNVLTHWTGAINIDGCRVRDGFETGGKKPTYTANNVNAIDGRGMGGGAWENTAGRWPANLIHDGSDEVVGMFPKVKTGVAPAYASGTNNIYGKIKKRESNEVAINGGDTGSAARFFYCAKASKRERGEDNNHPTVKPTNLMRYLCRLVTPPNGTVLDPFMGSGSTGKSAKLEGFNFIGIELDKTYFDIASKRINNQSPQIELEYA